MSRGEPGIFAEQRMPGLRSMKEDEQDKMSSKTRTDLGNHYSTLQSRVC